MTPPLLSVDQVSRAFTVGSVIGGTEMSCWIAPRVQVWPPLSLWKMYPNSPMIQQYCELGRQ